MRIFTNNLLSNETHFTNFTEKEIPVIDRKNSEVHIINIKSSIITVADSGFPRGGTTTLNPSYYSTNFSPKLHENEEILARGGGTHPSRPEICHCIITS